MSEAKGLAAKQVGGPAGPVGAAGLLADPFAGRGDD